MRDSSIRARLYLWLPGGMDWGEKKGGGETQNRCGAVWQGGDGYLSVREGARDTDGFHKKWGVWKGKELLAHSHTHMPE